MYMSFQTWTPLPPLTPYHLSASSPCTSPKHPVSCIEHRLAIRFLHVSMPFSQIIPPSPSPSESKSPLYTSVSLLLSRTLGHHYHLSKFHIYVLVYCIGVFLSGLLYIKFSSNLFSVSIYGQIFVTLILFSPLQFFRMYRMLTSIHI